MNEKELKEIFGKLEEQGWMPMLCDTPVGISSSKVKCGLPTEIGDESIDDYWMIPKAIVGCHPSYEKQVTRSKETEQRTG